MRALDPRRLAPSQRGFFLIEAMVAILIFALGILGLVAMGGTAVSSQSDAQYRTEASSLADAIAGEVALGIDRTSQANKAASLLNFAHQANSGADDAAGALCVQRRGRSMPVPRPAWRRCSSRAANLGPGPGLPGATAANQQIFVDAPGNFNRVVITLCWKTASDTRLAPSHARDVRQLRSTWPPASLHRRAVARSACRWSRSWSASRSA